MPEPIEILVQPRVVRNDGSVPFVAPQVGVDPVGPQDLVTRGWAESNLGSGGGPDPYPQYSLVDGSRDFTGPVKGVAGSHADSLTTKGYCDFAISTSQSTILGLASLAFQPLAPNLTGLSSLPPAADQLPYFTTSGGAMAITTLTSFSRTLLDDTSASGWLNTLGGGSAPTGTGGVVLATGPTLTLTNATGLPTAGLVNDAVTNAKLANMANNTVKCRVTAGTGDPEDAPFASFCLAAKIPFVLASEAGDPVRTVGASSTAEATLSSLTLTKGLIGTTGFAVLEIYGDLLQNWAGTNHGTMRIKVGSTTVYAKNLDCAQDPDIRPWCIRVVVANKGATGKQRVTAVIGIGEAVAATSGEGDIGTFSGATHTLYGECTEDTASTNLAITVTNQWDTSDASSYFRIYHAKLTVYP